MSESSDLERKLSRQERRQAERQAGKKPSPIPQRPKQPTVRFYAGEISALFWPWLDSAQRMQALSAQIGARFADPAWQAAVLAEARSWCELPDALTTSVPSAAQRVQGDAVLWLAAAAALGEALVAGIEAGDDDRVRHALDQELRTVMARGRAVNHTVRDLAEREQEARGQRAAREHPDRRR
jgi:hypothetical protein